MGWSFGVRALALSAAAAALAAVGPAWAGTYDCGAFTLIAGDKTTNRLDHAPEGDSVGDVRVLTRKLNDADGEQAVMAYMVSTLAEARAAGDHVFVGDFHCSLPGGVIVAKVVYERPNDTTAYTDGMTAIVTGGSGAYAGARGTVEIEAGNHPAYHFKLVCDAM